MQIHFSSYFNILALAYNQFHIEVSAFQVNVAKIHAKNRYVVYVFGPTYAILIQSKN